MRPTARVLSVVLGVMSVGDLYFDCGRSSLVRVYIRVGLDPDRAAAPHRPSVEKRHVPGARCTAPTGSCPNGDLPAAARRFKGTAPAAPAC